MEKLDISDIHIHLNADDSVGCEAEELALARKIGVIRHNVVGFNAPAIECVIGLAEKSPEIYAAIGWHPTEVDSYNQEIGDMTVANLSYPKVIGPDETGLDYHQMEDPKDVQMRAFKRQIQLSEGRSLSFIAHTHDAFEDTYAVIKEASVGPCGGIVYSFSDSLEMAERLIGLGMMISFPGVATFKKTFDVQEAAQRLPLDKILAEMDVPYLASVPKCGHESHTAYTRYVVDKITEPRGLTGEEMVKTTSDNAKRLSNCN